MTWRSAICFSLAFLAVNAVPLWAVAISGTVALRDSRLDSVNKRRDYSGIVISLTPVRGGALTPPAKHVVMTQKNKTFLPHVLPVGEGTTIDFPNFDPIFHSAFSSYNGQVFDLGLYAPGSTRSVRFTRPGAVRVFCNIHPTMSAVILVLNTPYFTTTQKDGSFEIDVPPGAYDLNVFHERASEQTLQELSRRVLVTDKPLQVPLIAVSESGYLPAPHKNKYGMDYAPPPDGHVGYPAEKSR
jgi:plastocyanin